ncbi:hypothetical protein COO60DRAFT_1751228 [Scenedesmus sp. NREL 46B-D3]|nr:hypothetical protein COO60DRAFT_1751228 [Scenedesmus sp. NREL 46B-D3]
MGQLQDPNQLHLQQQHYGMAAQGESSSGLMMMQQDDLGVSAAAAAAAAPPDMAAAGSWGAPGAAGECGVLPGFPVASNPGSPFDAAASGGLRPSALPCTDSLASHGSTDLPLGTGLPQFDALAGAMGGAFDASAGFAGLGGTSSMGAGAMHCAGGSLPQIGAGSPRSSSSPALSFGNAANNCSNDGYKQHQQQGNGRTAQQQQRESQREQQQQQRAAAAAAAHGAGGACAAAPVFRSQYRGVSYDKKKRKWRVQIKVAALGKSGVSVGYFDTEDAAARAYDRAAIGLLGRQNCRAILNFPIEEYDNDSVPELVGKSREEVKATLKSERAKLPRRRLTNRRRTSRYLGVGSSNRKNQWQARILYHGKVTHLGYYRTEEEAARVYDKVSISLHGAAAQTNFPIDQYKHEVGSLQQKLSGLTREELQRALGVKPMDKSSTFRGVSKKKGRWEAKVMLNRKWAYRELFDTEQEAARAYDTADHQLELHPTGLPLTAKPLIDAGLLFDDEGQSIRAPNGATRSVSIGDLASLGDSAGQSASEPSAGNISGSGGGGCAAAPAHSGGGTSGGAAGAVAGAGRAAAAARRVWRRRRRRGGGSLAMGGAPLSPPDPAAAAAAPVPLGSLAGRGLQGELASHNMHGVRPSGMSGLSGMHSLDAAGGHSHGGVFGQQQQQQHMGEHMGQLGGSSMGSVVRCSSSSSSSSQQQHQQQQYPYQQQQQQQQFMGGGHGPGGQQLEGTFWNTELSNQMPDHYHHQQQQHQQQHQHPGLRMSRSCGNLAFMAAGVSSPPALAPPAAATHNSPGIGSSPRASLQGTFSGSANEFAAESKPLMVRVGSEQHLINPNPTALQSGINRIASESNLSNMVPISPSSNLGFLSGPERRLMAHQGWGTESSGFVPQHSSSHVQMGQHQMGSSQRLQYQQQQQQQPPQHGGFYQSGAGGAGFQQQQHQHQHLQQQHYQQQQHQGPGAGAFMGGPPSGHPGSMQQCAATSMGQAQQQQQQQQQHVRRNSPGLPRAHSCAQLASIDETSVYGHHMVHAHSVGSADADAGRAHSLPGSLQGAPGGYGMHPQQQQQHGMMGSGMPSHPGAVHSGGMQLHADPAAAAAGYYSSHHAAAAAAGGFSGSHHGSSGPVSAGSVYNRSPVELHRHMHGAAAGFAAAPAAAGQMLARRVDAWGEGPDSPIGNVQIGGEDLDVAMAFLNDGSPPRRFTEADNLVDSLGLGALDPPMRLASPTHSNSASALLYDSGLTAALGGDLAMKMDD